MIYNCQLQKSTILNCSLQPNGSLPKCSACSITAWVHYPNANASQHENFLHVYPKHYFMCNPLNTLFVVTQNREHSIIYLSIHA